jgi:serine/threonine-protein kinase PpkA
MADSADSHSTRDHSTRLLAMGVELGYMSQVQADDALKRQRDLRKGRIQLSLQQVMLEMGLITPTQLRTINDELELRRAQAARSSAMMAAASSTIGNYQVLSILSDNGYTQVLKAVHTQTGKKAVLKVLPAALSQHSQWLERFRREMNLVANLSHPNIIGVYECASVDSVPYIAFEYLEGMNVSLRLEREGNFPEKTAWMISREVARGLSFIEERGILHRDIKPDNVLCGVDGRVKIIDLGLSKSLLDATTITALGETVGTPFYMSPEQATGTRGLDHRTDIYALGCVTFHMLTGSVPFFANDAVQVMLKHNELGRPDPRDIIPELSKETTVLVKWMMAHSVDDRPASANQLADAMSELISRLPDPPAGSRSMWAVVPSLSD